MTSLDSITLYLVATMVAALLGAMMVFFGRQENSPALKWWGTAYLLGAASVALWTAAGDRLGPHLGVCSLVRGVLRPAGIAHDDSAAAGRLQPQHAI